MRVGGRWGAHPAVAKVRQRARRIARTPAFGIAVITPLVLAGAVGGAAPKLPGTMPAVRANVNPVAAVSPVGPDPSGPGIVAVERPPTNFHVVGSSVSAPPPPMIVNARGALGIPMIALTAYRTAEARMAVAAPNCGVSWNLLAGIGRIESMHANNGAVDARGTAVYPIYGPTLDGSLAGNEVIIQSSVGNRVTYARAMGPMQFLPGTWARYAADSSADPQNLFDAALAAARYLCSGGLNLRDSTGIMAAILRYNNSMSYAQNVLGWAAAYATGVVPVDLPPITGPPPPLGDAHDEHPEGLGPNLPLNVNGLPRDDAWSQIPLIDFGAQQQVGQPPMYPWMAQTPPQSQTAQPGCTVICIGSQAGPTPNLPNGPNLPNAPLPNVPVPPASNGLPWAPPAAAPAQEPQAPASQTPSPKPARPAGPTSPSVATNTPSPGEPVPGAGA